MSKQLLRRFTFYLLLIHVIALPALARVDRRSGDCFERQITSPTITKDLGRCTIYIGTYGFHRALFGFHFPSGRRVDAWMDAKTGAVTVNTRRGYLYSPTKRNPDQLLADQYFCLGYRGSNLLTCGRLQ
jgi:hypothetical protein